HRAKPIARLLLGPLRGPHRHRAQAGLPGSFSGRYAARIVTGLSRLPGSSSGRYAARIVTGLRLDCPAPSRAATRPASSPGSGWIARLLLGPLRGPHRHRAKPIARLLLGPLRGPHRHRAQAGLPGSSSGRYAARIVTGLSRLPGSSSGRYAARIVTGLRLDCPAPPRAATRPASSPG
ncbi:hypothetical protein ACNJR1_19560, partial [Mycobacterium tuberculosis]